MGTVTVIANEGNEGWAAYFITVAKVLMVVMWSTSGYIRSSQTYILGWKPGLIRLVSVQNQFQFFFPTIAPSAYIAINTE